MMKKEYHLNIGKNANQRKKINNFKKMKLSVEYKQLLPEKGQQKEKDIDITVNMISYCVSKVYPDGFDSNGPQRRMYGRLQERMEEAKVNNTNEFEVEQGDLDILKKVVREAKTPVGWSSLIIQLEDALDNLTE